MFTEKELIDSNFINNLNLESGNFILHDYFREAYDLSEDLSNSIEKIKDFKFKYPQLYDEYNKTIIKLKWVGIQILQKQAILDLFKKYFTAIFEIEYYDIFDKLRVTMLGILNLKDRDALKMEIIEALKNNQEKITSQKLIIGNEEKQPLIANWFVDYFGTVGAIKTDRLAKSQYMVNSLNIRNLSENEKNKIKILFNLYERLKISSQTIEGLEEDIPVDEEGVKGFIRGGVFEPAAKETEFEKKMQAAIERVNKWTYEKDEREKKEIELKKVINTSLDGSLQKMAADEEIEKSSRVNVLEKEASKFPIGSLERMAIDEEITRLNRE